MGMIDGGAIFGKALANEGIEKAFVLCGGHVMPIFYGIRDVGIEIIDMRHECAAVYAAIAYTRASGKAAVVITTAGPGVGNTPNGMMEAASMGIPLLQIGGAVSMNLRDAGDLQDMDTLKLMKSCSKWAKRITSTERIPQYVSMAFRHAMEPTPGPVYLEIPTDLLAVKRKEEDLHFPVNYRANGIPQGDPALVDAAAALLAKAQRPAMIVDEGARFSIGDHAGSIAALSDYLKMPVGIIGTACRGLFGDEYENPLLNVNASPGADVVLALGCRFDFRLAFGHRIPKDAKVIQVHTDTKQIGFNLRADIGIVGGTGPVAGQLMEAVKQKRDTPADVSWIGERKKRTVEKLSDEFKAEGSPVHPGRCAGEVAKFLEEEGRDWTVITDGGEAAVWMNIASVAHHPGQIHTSGPNGTIGTGPCLAIGAWVANRKPVLWYTGDGSFGYHAMEMDTMARLGIPVVCVISNDSGWGMIRLTEGFLRTKEVEEKGHCGCELHDLRAYEKMAAMYDGYGECVKDPAEILPAIKRAAANGKPSIINVEVDKVSLSPFIAAYAAMVKPS